MIFKLFSNFFGYLFLLFLLLSPLLLVLGALLIWKGSGIIRVLGWLLLLLSAYYRLHWISPLYVIRGGDRVQKYRLSGQFRSDNPVRWMDTPPRLLLVPSDRITINPEPPHYNQVRFIDLETRQTQWQPKDEVNLDETKRIEELPTGLSKLGTRFESSYIGFSLSVLYYRIPWVFSEASGWQWEKTYFGWLRYAIRESESDPVVVELNQIVFNSQRNLAGASGRWVMGGKFSIIKPLEYVDRRVLVLGPFNSSIEPQSTDSNSNEEVKSVN